MMDSLTFTSLLCCEIKENTPEAPCSKGERSSRYHLVHHSLTEMTLRSANTLLRCDGRSRHDLCEPRSAMRLQDHLRQTLLYLFPPIEALCDVSVCLLFSSLSLRYEIQRLKLVYTQLTSLVNRKLSLLSFFGKRTHFDGSVG